jgi:hypothetical protein
LQQHKLGLAGGKRNNGIRSATVAEPVGSAGARVEVFGAFFSSDSQDCGRGGSHSSQAKSDLAGDFLWTLGLSGLFTSAVTKIFTVSFFAYF